ncbi:SanA/YdcF family protein [Urechidicola croceus]|uniref:Protein SanA n=1 Tax=Urechidicola croceus TaxID=1850246 RepID=A0A1D8P8K9_9FLAO|nr:ElyC/SanA/YdcF family protein [Urechidicola croceus]AOW20928.1 protein SanA [Urechidicola croceus]
MRKLLKLGLKIGLLLLAVIFISNIYVELKAKEKTYNSVTKIPYNKVGVVLGTSKYYTKGQINLFYKYRIEATITLYKANKIKYVIVSGDHGTKYYDEPTTFKEDLMAGGIPEENIFLDHAGFRTLDSMVRSKEVFGQESVTVISQQFHNERAITIASSKGINAVGFNAHNVGGKSGLKVKFRELFARVKLSLDLLFNKKPKFLGDKILIPE